MLTILDTLPPGLLSAEPTGVHEVLTGPTLIHLPGRRAPALFVSALLHGNETTGLLAIQELLRRHADAGLPRALSLFIGNVEAARYGLRRLDHQPDYNRIWTGEGTLEHDMMRSVLEEMRERGVFASVDVHNNTGHNPHYACVNRLDHGFLQLAALFGRTVVYFIRPEGVQTSAFAQLCPAVTLECGQPGTAAGVQHAYEYLEACLNLEAVPDHPVAPHDIDLFHTVAVVKVPPDVSFGFGDTATDIQFAEDLDRLNFSELPSGTVLGRVHPDSQVRLAVTDEGGDEVSDRYFSFQDNEIRLQAPVMPSMLTLNPQIIRQDCLCYLMERLSMPP